MSLIAGDAIDPPSPSQDGADPVPPCRRCGAVLFDLDGTLLDTLGDIADSVNAALRGLGCAGHDRAAFKHFVGDGVETLLRRTLPPQRCDAATIAEGCRLMRQEYAQRWAATTRPYAGIPELLDALVARRVPLAVLSNKPDDFTQLCAQRWLSGWPLAVVLGHCPPRPKKPDPAGALEIAQRLAVPPAEFLYVGDTDTDMQTARAAGMLAVGALWGFREADELLAHGAQRLVAQPSEILNLLSDA